MCLFSCNNLSHCYSSVIQSVYGITLLFSEVLVNGSHPYRIDIPILSSPIAYLEHVIFTVTFDVQLVS